MKYLQHPLVSVLLFQFLLFSFHALLASYIIATYVLTPVLGVLVIAYVILAWILSVKLATNIVTWRDQSRKYETLRAKFVLTSMVDPVFAQALIEASTRDEEYYAKVVDSPDFLSKEVQNNLDRAVEFLNNYKDPAFRARHNLEQ